MLTTPRTITLGLALAAALTPAAALAKNGADDGPTRAGDDKGGQRAADDKGGARPGDDKGGRRADDRRVGDDKGGRRAVRSKSKGKRVVGSCTGRSSSKLKSKPDDGRLETEFEVDQNRNGVKWAVRIRRNGKLAVKTTATTKAPSGSFSVERRLRNGSGKDRITAKATSPSGEVCTARLTI